jgi:hypothetical protein
MADSMTTFLTTTAPMREYSVTALDASAVRGVELGYDVDKRKSAKNKETSRRVAFAATSNYGFTSGHGLRRSKPTMSLPVKVLQSLRRGFDHGNKEGETRRSAAAVWQEVFVDTAKYVDWGLRVGCSALRVKTMFSQWGQKTKKSNLEEPAAAAAATGEDGEGGEERNLEAAAAAGSANAAGGDGQGVEVEVILDDVTSVTVLYS